MSERIIRGSVTGDGTITAGTGFRVSHGKTGVYDIFFDRGTFGDVPTIVATVISNSALDDKTRKNAVVQRDALTADSFVMITGDDDGDLSNDDFGFIAIGPAPPKS